MSIKHFKDGYKTKHHSTAPLSRPTGSQMSHHDDKTVARQVVNTIPGTKDSVSKQAPQSGWKQGPTTGL